MLLPVHQGATVYFNREITMKKIAKTTIAALLLAAVAMPALADREDKGGRDKKEQKEQKRHQPGPMHFDRDSFHANTVPEINGAGAALALALLGGIVLIARERRNS